MIYDEEEQSIRCFECGAELPARAARLSDAEKARLASFRDFHQRRTGTRLSPARDPRDI